MHLKLPEQEFIEWLEAEDLSERTVYEYRMNLKNLEGFTQKHIDEFIQRRPNRVSRAFVKKYKEFLILNHKKFDFTQEQLNRIQGIIVRKKKSKPRKIPKYITPDEMEMISKHLGKYQHVVMLYIMFWAGLRRFELLKLRAGDFDWKRWAKDTTQPGLLKVKGKGDREAIIPVNPKVMHMLKDYIKGNFNKENFDYNQRLFRGVTSGHFARVYKDAGMRALGREISPHSARHGIAMYLQKQGWRIEETKEFLRHADISTTQIYARVEPQVIIEKYSNLVS